MSHFSVIPVLFTPFPFDFFGKIIKNSTFATKPGGIRGLFAMMSAKGVFCPDLSQNVGL